MISTTQTTRNNFITGNNGIKNQFTVLVLDQSISMDTSDWEPTRMHGLKDAVSSFIKQTIQNNPNEFIGVVSFNHDGYIKHPLVPVSVSFNSLLQTVNELIPHGGTDIHSALITCLQLLYPFFPLAINNYLTLLRIILVTDGWGGDAREIANHLKELGVCIVCIGVGGSPKDVDEQLLKDIASERDGRLLYRFIGDQQVLKRHFNELIINR